MRNRTLNRIPNLTAESSSGDKPADDDGELTLDPHSDLLALGGRALREATLTQAYQRLQIIYGLARSLMRETGLSAILDTAVRALVDNLSAERCLIGRVGPHDEILPLRAHRIDVPTDDGPWPISTTIVSRVVADSRAILSADAVQDRRFEDAASVAVEQIRSVVCAPMGPRDACEGFIYLDNRCEIGRFTDVDLQFVTALSHFIHLALQNAERLEAMRADQELSDRRWAALQEEIFRDHQIIGRSPKLLSAYEVLRKAAKKDVPLLLRGETGTGKELFAKAAHQLSPRRDSPFIAVNVAALAESLVESELFGHTKGAFTGAITDKAGRLELADGGTLFLDEVAEIPLPIQAKLLRVLDTAEVERVGEFKPKRVSVRLICATNRDLEQRVKEGAFRDDLYWRLKGVAIELPPLRERREDVPELIAFFTKRLHSSKSYRPDALQRLVEYHWPGNVRQLARFVEEMDAICEIDAVRAEDLPSHIAGREPASHSNRLQDDFVPLDAAVEALERELFGKALALTNGNHERAMKLLGVSRSKYYDRKKAFGF